MISATERRGSYAATGIAFAIALAAIGGLMDRSIGPYDESLMLVGARRMQAGEMVHRDFYFIYGPAGLWVLTKLWLLGPQQFLLARLYGLATAAGIVALAFHLLAPRVNAWVAMTFSSICLLWLIAFGNYLYPTFQCMLLALLSSALLLHREATRRGHEAERAWGFGLRARLLTAGACAGSATLFRYDTGVFIALAQVIWLILTWRTDPADGDRTMAILRGVGWYAAGFVAVLAVPVFDFLGRAPPIDLWRDIVGSSTTYYLTHRSLPFPSLRDVVDHPREGGVYIPLFAIAVALVCRKHITTRGDGHERPAVIDPFALLMGIFTVLLYYKGIVRAQSLHFVLSILPATLLLAVCVDRLWGGGRVARVAAVAVTLIGAAPAARASAGVASELRTTPTLIVAGWILERNNPIGTDRDPVAQCLDDSKTYLAWMPLAGVQASAFVRAHTDPAERVFVATGRHDRFVTNDLALYYTMDRLPGTHWHAFDPGLQTRRDIQEKMISDLIANRVRWIVRDPSFDQIREPNASSKSSGVFLLDRWISAHYRPIGLARPLTIWLRNDQPAPRLDAGSAACRLAPPPR